MFKKSKSIVSFLAAMCVAVTFGSCDKLMGIDLTDQKSVDGVRAVIGKHIDPQSVIIDMSLMTTADFSLRMDLASVVYIAPGSTEVKTTVVPLSGNQKPRDSKTFKTYESRTPESGIKLSELDFSKVAANIAQASEVLKNENMSTDGIKMYDIRIADGNAANVLHVFDVRSKENTELGTKNGRAGLVTNYYETEFTADASGNVTYKED